MIRAASSASSLAATGGEATTKIPAASAAARARDKSQRPIASDRVTPRMCSKPTRPSAGRASGKEPGEGEPEPPGVRAGWACPRGVTPDGMGRQVVALVEGSRGQFPPAGSLHSPRLLAGPRLAPLWNVLVSA